MIKEIISNIPLLILFLKKIVISVLNIQQIMKLLFLILVSKEIIRQLFLHGQLVMLMISAIIELMLLIHHQFKLHGIVIHRKLVMDLEKILLKVG